MIDIKIGALLVSIIIPACSPLNTCHDHGTLFLIQGNVVSNANSFDINGKINDTYIEWEYQYYHSYKPVGNNRLSISNIRLSFPIPHGECRFLLNETGVLSNNVKQEYQLHYYFRPIPGNEGDSYLPEEFYCKTFTNDNKLIIGRAKKISITSSYDPTIDIYHYVNRIIADMTFCPKKEAFFPEEGKDPFCTKDSILGVATIDISYKFNGYSEEESCLYDK